MLYARVPTPWDPNEKPKAQIVSGIEPTRISKETAPPTVFQLEERRPDLEYIVNSQYVQPEGKPIELRAREAPRRRRLFIPFEDRGSITANVLPQDQDVIGVWNYQPWKLLKRGKQRVYFRFEDRHWNIAFERETQIAADWRIAPKTWYAIRDPDYFPPRLKTWLKGRCFMLVRLRSGAGLGTPRNGYVTEDGSIFYVAEDGLTFYVQES